MGASEHHADPRPDDLPSSYEAAVDWLFGRVNFERQPPGAAGGPALKLATMRSLLRELGDPQEQLPAIHIAGTKGKGSTAAIAAAVLRAAGKRVGLFTSPHLERFEERLQVNGVQPTARQVLDLVQELHGATQRITQAGHANPTFFELITAMAWSYFLQQQVELVVLEVGLGGRLDTTNLCCPRATVITNISLDHTDLLGDTEAAIAAEKAGILKMGIPLVCGVRQPEAAAVIRRMAGERQVPVRWIDEQFQAEYRAVISADGKSLTTEASSARTLMDMVIDGQRISDLSLPLLGRHQADNAALAVEACRIGLGDEPLSEEAIRAGMSQVRCRARIEQVAADPTVIVDSAHNPASIQSLVETIEESFSERRRAVLFATSRDKDAAAMLGCLARCFDTIVVTQYGMPARGIPVDELEQLAHEATVGCSAPPRIVAQPSVEAGWVELIERPGHDLICITGSFYLAAEVQTLLATPRQTPLGVSEH